MTTASVASQALSDLADVVAALRDKLQNIPEDEAVVVDAATIAAELLAGPLAPIAVRVAPMIVSLIFFVITHNRSADPGALNHIGSGGRGSDPWLKEPPR